MMGVSPAVFSVDQIFFTPLLPWPLLALLAVAAALLLLLAIWRRLPGWPLRALALVALTLVLAGPKLQEGSRDPLPDILLVLSDETASQSLGDRHEMRNQALDWLQQSALTAGLELRQAAISDVPDQGGSFLLPALERALSTLPPAQLAGVVVVSDGAFQDQPALADRLARLPVPVHLLQNGRRSDWDRRLTILRAPRFAVTGESTAVQLRIEALGQAPSAPAELLISIDGAPPTSHMVRVGLDLELPLELQHAGETVVHLSLVPLDGELTARNNQAALRINGIRDGLRVLLVSGEPHPGTRTWRNLLKSDASVDLVHFTILRPPEKQDGVPVNELSLIPFPTQELFIEKIDEFDLIIFDRYRLRGILPGAYLESVRAYVERGGAVLVAAGPEFAGVESLSRSPLGDVLPARPIGQVLDGPMRPEVTDLGQRHPVTRALQQGKAWGAWLRYLDVDATQGQVVVQSPEGRPLLMLDRVGDGRVALIATDQLWLWARGYDGGGPQLELLRRLAHWMMGEPELEEEALAVREAPDGDIIVTRQTLSEEPDPLVVEAPDGSRTKLPMRAEGPGRFVARLSDEMALEEGAPQGVYRFSQGERGSEKSVVAVRGAAAPLEFAEPLALPDPMRAILSANRGGVWPLQDGVPRMRAVRPGDVAIGRGWIGYTPRDAFVSRDLRVRPALPPIMWLLIIAGGMVLAWWLEGRRASSPLP